MSREIKGFYHYNESWYSKTNPRDHDDEIMIGIYSIREDGADDGCVAEMAIRWKTLGGRSVLKLEIFNDAFALLGKMPEIIEHLIKVGDSGVTPQDLTTALIGFGYKDKTARISPFGEIDERALALAKLNQREREVLGLAVKP